MFFFLRSVLSFEKNYVACYEKCVRGGATSEIDEVGDSCKKKEQKVPVSGGIAWFWVSRSVSYLSNSAWNSSKESDFSWTANEKSTEYKVPGNIK